MEKLLETRENLIYFYKKHEKAIDFILKFIFYCIAFSYVLNINMYSPTFSFLFEGVKGLIIFVSCVAFAMIFSTTLTYSLIIVMVAFGLSNYILLDIIVVATLLCIYLFYIRVAYNENIIVLGTLILSFIKLPYLIGFIVGLFFPITSVLAIFFGSFIHHIFGFIKQVQLNSETLASTSSITIDNIDTTLGEINTVTYSLFANTDWIFLTIVICTGVIAINLICKFDIKNKFYIAISCASIIYFIGTMFIIIFTETNIGIFTALLGLILSIIIAFIMQFFSIVLDYESQEKVQFFDGENYYYVKIIPRYIVKKDKARHNHINEKSNEMDMNKIRKMARGNTER